MAQFLNVDVDLFGPFDREALVRGFGDRISVLRNEENEDGEAVVSFESSVATPTFPGVVSELIALVHALPSDARDAWDRATRRVFDIGIRSGFDLHSIQWRLSAEQVAALASLGVEVTITLYGAKLDSS